MSKKESKIPIQKQKEKALDISIKEGSSASISSSLGDGYISAFATEVAQKINPLNTALQVGILSALSSLASPIAQLYGSRMMEKHSRKNIVTYFILLQAILWIPLAAISILFYFNIINLSTPYLIISLYALISIVGGLAYPAWFSWMGDLVPPEKRGEYFSKRTKITGAIGLIATLIGAGLIHLFEVASLTLIGFGILFTLAFFFRFLSFRKMKKQFSPKFKFQKENDFTFWQFVKRYDNYGKFAFYQAWFNFAVMVASPFFIVYMKQNLQFSYGMIMVISLSSSIFYLLFTKFAGKFSDKYGNVKLLYLANFCFILTPLLYIVNSSPLWLIIFPQLISGLGNAALVISTTNFTYDAVSQQKRGICISYTNILIGIGAFLGSIIGGILLKYVTIPFLEKFVFLFLLAATLRLLVFILFIKSLREVKHVSKWHPVQLYLSHPFKTIHHEIGNLEDFANKRLSQSLKVLKSANNHVF